MLNMKLEKYNAETGLALLKDKHGLYAVAYYIGGAVVLQDAIPCLSKADGELCYNVEIAWQEEAERMADEVDDEAEAEDMPFLDWDWEL